MALVEKYVTADSDGGDGSISNPWTLTEAFANAIAGDRVNILSGTYERSSSDAVTNAGAVGSPILFRGVSSFSPLTPIANLWSATGLITTGMPFINYAPTYTLVNAKDHVYWHSLRVEGSAGSKAIFGGSSNANGGAYNCRFYNSAASSYADAARGGSYYAFIGCEFETNGTTNSKPLYGSAECCVYNCRLKSNVSHSTNYCLGLSTVVEDTIFIGSVGLSGFASNNIRIKNCTFYGCTEAIITPNSAQTRPLNIINCIFANCGYALYNPYNATAAHPLLSVNNLYYDIDNANLGFGDWPEIGRIDAAADPFVDSANGDLRLKRTSEAVNAATNGGDIGAIQRPAVWPVATDLRSGTTVDGITGTLDLPAVSDVQEGVVFDNTTKTGTFVVPLENTVQENVTYGAAEEYTGTLDVGSTAQEVWEYGIRILTANTNLSIPSEPPTVTQIRTELDNNSTKLADIVEDTNELQTDLTEGGRLDLIINAILEDTGTTLEDKITKIKAAVYDSATINEDTITLSNGTTQTASVAGRETTEV